jgi:hypothetical protein
MTREAPMAESKPRSLPESLGFREGPSSVHTSRTMMLKELSSVLDRVFPNGKPDAYVSAIVDENVLGKPTQTTRLRTAKRLSQLYSLDPDCTLFRLLRHFWSANDGGRPMLAFLAAAARDPLLREATPSILGVPIGTEVTAVEIGDYLNSKYPGRFRPTTLHSTAQNLASSWTQADYVTGKVKKKRSRPIVTPVVAGFAVLFGYLGGFRGKSLLDTAWTRLLDRSPGEITDLVAEASRQGWLNYKAAGSVVEVTFPGLLTPHEERAAHEQN